jgi:hypothetical protein
LKVFGINITSVPTVPTQLELPVVKDAIPEIKVSIPDTKAPALMPNVKNPTLGYNTNKHKGRGYFRNAEYNLAEVGRIEDTDSYVRQAHNKKVSLLLKEGWTLVGKNPRTIKYIQARFAQISQAGGTPTEQLIRKIASGLVRKSNTFVTKVRKLEASGGRMRSQPGKKIPLEPVAAYFITPSETMEYEMSGNKITKWKQSMPNGDEKFYPPRDVVHFYYEQKEGFVFGTPIITPVVDDIRALRKIEENIELLIYQHLFPLFQYKVGTPEMPAGMTEDGRREIDVVRQEIMYMPTEGGIVTPERHEITAVGAEGRAIRAEGYLEHFKKRVFSGLGVSAVDMGEGETANRATADNMSRNLIDSVKDFQQVLESFFNENIINELLLESTFGDNVLDEDNLVKLKFKEIDVDSQIKKENHAADLFAKDIIDHDESRRRIGLEPWIIPNPDEVESETDTPESFPQWHKSRWKMYQLPTLLIQSMDEPWSPTAKAAAADSSLPVTTKSNEESANERNKQEVDLEKEKTKAKVAVAKAKPAPKDAVKNGHLHSTFMEAQRDVVERITASKQIDHDWISSLIRTQMQTTIDVLIADQLVAFRKGYASQGADVTSDLFVRTVTTARTSLRERAEYYILKLTNNIIGSLQRNVDNNADLAEIATKARAVFESMEYRTKFIEDVEINKAFNYGSVLASRDQGKTLLTIKAKEDTSSTIAQSRDGQILDLGLLTLDDIPPFHANDTTSFEITDASFDEATPDVQESGDITSCTKCGKTAIRVKNTPNNFRCNACSTVFTSKTSQVSKTPDDQNELPGPILQNAIKKSKHARFRKCVSKVKARIKSKNPVIDDDELDQQAEIACAHIREMLEESDTLEDSEKGEQSE